MLTRSKLGLVAAVGVVVVACGSSSTPADSAGADGGTRPNGDAGTGTGALQRDTGAPERDTGTAPSGSGSGSGSHNDGGTSGSGSGAGDASTGPSVGLCYTWFDGGVVDFLPTGAVVQTGISAIP